MGTKNNHFRFSAPFPRDGALTIKINGVFMILINILPVFTSQPFNMGIGLKRRGRGGAKPTTTENRKD